MSTSEIICRISFPPVVKTRQLEVTSKKQIQYECVPMTQYFLYNLRELMFFYYTFSHLFIRSWPSALFRHDPLFTKGEEIVFFLQIDHLNFLSH